MKLEIKCSDSNPICVQSQRRTLGVYEFEKVGIDPLCSCKVENRSLDLNADEALILKDVSYTPSNQIVSIIIGYKAKKEEKNIFAAIFQFKNVPSYCAFLLPTGRFIELYIEV